MEKSTVYKAFFEENGYIVIDDAFSIDDLTTFKQNLDGLIKLAFKKAVIQYPALSLPPSGKELDEGLVTLSKVCPEYVSFVQRTIARSAEFIRLCSSPKITAIVKNLLNMPEDLPVYLTSNGVVFTNPNDTSKNVTNFDIDWHLDTFYTIPQSRFIQLWAPLYHDATKEIGTLMVCPGSNKVDPLEAKQKFNPEHGYNNQYYIEANDVEQYEHRSIEVKLGQLLIFDGRTIHRSGKNTSEHVRCTLLGLCHHVGAEAFTPMTALYKYHGKTPEGLFYELYGDERAKEHMYDHAAVSKPLGGV